ncbi:hypothetical protein cce_5303 (plasmid) [Crocosphaera subtropica ATCC 51142]|uniref:Phytase-like domain-containing protein n=1 Tax=Crocosphaera subtropica (strain ATCC 51142 / BH68) TaxID=43989 RepID=B1X3D8_CROS5|nr:hypothetical protein [Crocosphaera subtropica]ACB54649.1 hypothetical protein cce_5303 [Crocosphaera subtropica ATCC 51142]
MFLFDNFSRKILSSLPSFISVFISLTMGSIPNAKAVPTLVNSDRFKVELFVDLASIDPDLDAFQLTISSGENGFPAGLYVTPGPSFLPGGNRLMRIDHAGTISIVTDQLNSAESMLFARGSYGDGILISEPRDQRIRRLLSDGTLTTFASNISSSPFGPPVLTYGPGGVIFATDGSIGSDSQASRDILQINSDGSSNVFASVSSAIFPEPTLTTFIHRHKPAAYASINDLGQWQEGGGFVTGTFSLQTDGEATMNDALFLVNLDGTSTLLVDGLSGLELIELGPGGVFGSDLFVATEGSSFGNDDGTLFTLKPDGTLIPFLTNIDAIDVAFDTEGILGGGLFVSDGTNRAGAGKIWRITSVTVPESSSLLSLFTFSILVISLIPKHKHNN